MESPKRTSSLHAVRRYLYYVGCLCSSTSIRQLYLHHGLLRVRHSQLELQYRVNSADFGSRNQLFVDAGHVTMAALAATTGGSKRISRASTYSSGVSVYDPVTRGARCGGQIEINSGCGRRSVKASSTHRSHQYTLSW